MNVNGKRRTWRMENGGRFTPAIVYGLFSLFAISPAQAATYAVKAAGGGDYTTIQACANAMNNGDTCVVYGGTYNEHVNLSAGGVGAYKTLQVNGTDLVYVYDFTVNSHNKVIGFHIQNPSSPYGKDCVSIANGATDIYITNNNFYACGYHAAISPAGSSATNSYVSIQGNTITYPCTTSAIHDACKAIILAGDHALVENNDLSHTDDGIWLNGSYNVIRKNTFHDNYVSECSTDPASISYGCHIDFLQSEPASPTQHNIAEGNTVLNSVGANTHAFIPQANACAGQCFGLIIRFNVAAHVGEAGILDDNSGDRVDPGFSYVKSYNNTWADIANYAPIQLYGSNNAFTRNSTHGSDINDLFYYPQSMANYNPYATDASTIGTFTPKNNLAWCAGFPCSLHGSVYGSGLFTDDPGNQIADPKFANYAGNDFHLSTGSPAIGAGTSLTTVAAGDAGSGTSLQVVDVGFFQDGYGITGVQADWIAVGSAGHVVQIASINYGTNVLTLTAPISRQSGDPVFLYKDSSGRQVLYGSAPDIGAYEYVSGGGDTTSTFLDPSRAIDWTSVGSTIPNYTVNCSIQPSLTANDPSAAAANTTAIQNALASCDAAHNVVNIPAGTYYVAGWKYGTQGKQVVRGAGPMATYLYLTGGVACNGLWSPICMIGNNATYAGSVDVLPPGGARQCSWTDGYAQGSTSITLSNCGSSPPLNKTLVLDQANDVNDTNGIYICDDDPNCRTGHTNGNYSGRLINGVDHAQQQLVLVTGVTSLGGGSYSVTISPGVYFNNIRSSQSPGAWWPGFVQNEGLENLTFDRSLDATNSGSTIGMYSCYQCYVRNVRALYAKRSNVLVYYSLHDVIRDNYFYQAQGHASQSYNIEFQVSSEVLIENNIMQQMTNPILFGQGAGNVVGYNFSVDDIYGTGTWAEAAYYSHNAGNVMNLWEGNNFYGIWADAFWGSCALGTYFRNMLNGWQQGKTSGMWPITIRTMDRAFNVVGNVLGQPGYQRNYESYATSKTGGVNAALSNTSIFELGWTDNSGFGICTTPPGFGCDPLVRSTLMRWGNYDTVTNGTRWDSTEASPAAVPYVNANFTPFYFNSLTHALPASLYYSSKPSWWPATKAWPPVGPDVVSGNLGICGGTYAGAQATASGQCTGGGWTSAWAAHANSIPAQDCYLSVMQGPPDGTGPPLAFNADVCYRGATSNPPPGGLPQTLSLNFGDVLPVNATLAVTYSPPGGTANLQYVWTIAAAAGASSTLGSKAAPGAISSPESSKTSVPTLGLSSWPLSPGRYTISVYATDGTNVSNTASKTVTLVLADLSAVKVYPNPWRSDKHAGHPSVTFAGLTVGTTIKLFTVSGHDVKELHTDGPSIAWDLTNDSGDKVASGVYLYVITDGQGDKVRGKMAIMK